MFHFVKTLTMKKTYIIPVTEISPLSLEVSILVDSFTGEIGGETIPGGGEGGPGIPADVRKFDLWAEEDE